MRAKLDGASVLAFSLPTDIEWEDLREAAKVGRLTMPCCGVPAIPKTFHAHGTRFFAHKVRHQDCDWQGESEDHERLKTVAAKAAIDAGATAETEVSGPTWRADVMAEVAGARFAIEIQLSAQTTHITRQRTVGYLQDGVPVLWFMRRKPNDMTISESLRVLVLPEDEGDWPEFVARYTRLFVRGDLVWDDGRIDGVPVTLIGYDAICIRCGEIWHYTPWERHRYSEVSETLSDCIRSAGWERTSTDSGRPQDQRARRSCPHCGADKEHTGVTKDEAALYPWHYTDRTTTYLGPAGWRSRRSPGRPRPDSGDVSVWHAVLQKHGLVIDPVKLQPTVRHLRERWQAAETERMRREAAERQARLQQESARRFAIMALADDVARGANRVKVVVERFRDDYAGIQTITFSFPFHRGLVAAIKRTFPRARFDKASRTWKIEIGYGAAKGVLSMAKEMLDHLRAGNWPGDDGRFDEEDW